jgi:molecular chaperone DnaK
VTFDIDANGIVSVSAKDLATNQAQSVQVDPRGTLSREEFRKLVEEYAHDEGGVALKD